MGADELDQESFVLAADDPYLSALIGTIEEPAGSTNAAQARRLTIAWWERHGTGPSCTELLQAMFAGIVWDEAIEDPGRTLPERDEQVELLQRWLISYWTRLGAIAFTPGRDDIVRPGHLHLDSTDDRTKTT
jgi:hypothetical protein